MSKILIWDLDGTLLDSFGIYAAILANVLPKHGYEMPTQQALLANFHGSLEDAICGGVGDLTDEETQAILADFLLVQDTHYEVVQEHLFADALRLVERAHEAGYRQVLVANREHEGRLKASPRHIVQHSTLARYIDVVVCGDDSEHRKPKPEVLGSLAEQFSGAQILVVGDQFVDAEFARNLGARGALVNRGDNEIAHMGRLGSDWQSYAKVFSSLDEVTL